MWDTITLEEANDIVFGHLEEKKAEDEDIENVSFRGSEVGLHVKNTRRGRTKTIQVSSRKV